ncbi:hypothetical protein AURDEDRAFT_111384 [Auricularia subglabra TFB-10046 SS5]|nr:hypothetical protein AURDEDRAFT_111384 [Auricularia subglabra TFB-10046 SS5]
MPVHEMSDYIPYAKEVAARLVPDLWSNIAAWNGHDVSVEDARLGMPSTYGKTESPLYGPSARLLNAISLAYYCLTFDPSSPIRPIVFHSNSSKIIPGDYLGVQSKPDTGSGPGTLSGLIEAARRLEAQPRDDFPWSPHASVGETKNLLDDLMAQFKAYMASLCCYRPDTATVHGFRLAKAPGASDSAQAEHAYDIVLASLNACGLTCSPPIDVTCIDPWIAHVVMVYDSDAARYPWLRYAARETTFVRWDVELADAHVLALAPFYTTPPPGRVTFASFEVATIPAIGASIPDIGNQFRNHETFGFVKFSWQDDARVWKEADLLARLHKDGWLPGVVRPYPSQLKDTTITIEQLGVDNGTSRTFEMLHLGSIGEPLSQCRTPKEILMVAYDVLETSMNMIELDVLHRDLSWFNVFRKPRHDPKLSAEKPTLKRRCIASILGDEDAEPCALVADFDHSAVLSELLARDGATRKEKTGTPMFRALELSYPSALADHFNRETLNLDVLVSAFKAIERPEHRSYLLGAFPEDTLTFASVIKEIVEKEKERRNLVAEGDASERYIIKDSPHKPRHDAESVYWILLWALGRALPRGAPDQLTTQYNNFCGAMLREGSAIPGSGCREIYLKPQCVEDILHPELTCFQEMLVKMATYFSIPWERYKEEFKLGDDHAHIAMRRLLLLKFAQAHPALAVELDTEHPRRCTVFSKETRQRSLPASTLGKTGDAISKTEDDPFQTLAPPAAVAKRPHPGDGGDGDADVKGDGDGGGDDSTIPPRDPAPVKNTNKRHNAGKSGCGAESADATFNDRYTEKEHLDNRSVNSLRLKFWKDRLLWFGSGY